MRKEKDLVRTRNEKEAEDNGGDNLQCIRVREKREREREEEEERERGD